MYPTNSTIEYYSTYADRFYQKYEKLQSNEINALWADLIPQRKCRVLDIGAGSGRDATWLAQKGFDVIAVEPADGLRELAKNQYDKQAIRWVNDRLPELHHVKNLRLEFELILMNAVWMHIAPEYREEAFYTVSVLLRTGGVLIMTLRTGPCYDDRAMHPVYSRELIRYAKARRLECIFDIQRDDLFGRTEVSWKTIAFKKL